jgi:hypothetical protein
VSINEFRFINIWYKWSLAGQLFRSRRESKVAYFTGFTDKKKKKFAALAAGDRDPATPSFSRKKFKICDFLKINQF